MNVISAPKALEPSLTVPADSHPAIRLRGVSKVFSARKNAAEVAALQNIDLIVPQGRVLGVIGPSGAGKSTLIRLVNGLEKPSSGTINLFGRDVTSLTEQGWRHERRGIGMIFQHFNLLSSRTVFGNVALPLEIDGTPKAEIHARVNELLDLVGLSDKAARYPAELSGGQKQRVGIARALATKPAILLCDEATSALDPETTRSILALLKEVNAALGITILLITHEIPVIRDVCDEVAVIEAGHIIEQGSVFDVLTGPKHPTTARLVEGVTRVEVPGHLCAALTQSRANGMQAVLRVGFMGDHATSPVISSLTTTLGISVNILAGRIDAISGKPYGSLLVSVPAEAPAFEASLAALARLGLTVEHLGFIPTGENSHFTVKRAEYVR